MKNALILLAGGVGKRFGGAVPKQFFKIGNINLIDYFLTNLDESIFDIIIIVLKDNKIKKYFKEINQKYSQHNIKFAISGNTRQESSKKGLLKLKRYNPENVLIHDSARPLASNILIKNIIKKLNINETAIPYVKYNDLIISNKKDLVKKNQLNIQTPQGFKFIKILAIHKSTNLIDSKDDSLLVINSSKNLCFVKGDKINIKITHKEDLKFFNLIKKKEFRSGIGFDIHRIDKTKNKILKLCGVKIKHSPLIGHSDADVGYHALCDSLLGAISSKDIGFHFNNKNNKWKNMDSKYFVKYCYKLIFEKKFKIINIDMNFICETPNINIIANQMKINISKLVNISVKHISIKATTNEKIGFIGNGEGIAAEAIVQIVNE